jgi:hypothetical protein
MFHNPTNIARFIFAISLLTLAACSGRQANQTATNNQPAQSAQANTSNQPAPPATQSSPAKPVEAGALRPGEASGSYTAKGETVNLKYAYAGRAQRFGSEAIVILLTDAEIPAAALAEEIKSQTMLLDGKIRGLEYAIMTDGHWVRYHPGQYQESKSGGLKDYSVENDLVKGSDDGGDLTNGKYARSVKFVATISK